MITWNFFSLMRCYKYVWRHESSLCLLIFLWPILILSMKDGMPWRRSSSWIGSGHVPWQSMDDSGRPWAEHVQEDFEAHEWWGPIYQRVWKMLFLGYSWTSHASERLKKCRVGRQLCRGPNLKAFSVLTRDTSGIHPLDGLLCTTQIQ